MSTPWFPDLPGFAWGRTRSPKLNTLIQTSASGLEARQALQTLARREWKLIFNYLREGTPWFDVETLEGLYLAQTGPLSTMLFRDQYQNACVGQSIATGDGSTVTYQLQRTIQGYDEPVFVLDTRGSATYGPYTRPAALTPQAYVSGSPVSATFANETGIMTLASASGTSGNPITATFSYGFRVRFEDDSIDFDNLWGAVNEMKELKLIQTRV